MAYSEAGRQKKKQQIIEAAAELLMVKDYLQIAVREIAEELSISKGTLYNFFGSKEEIFLELYKAELENWLDELVAVFTSDQPFPQMLGDFVSRHCQRQLFVKLMACLNTE